MAEDNIVDLDFEDEVPANTVEDIDPAEWLATEDDVVTDTVTLRINGKTSRLKIAALTEGESNRILEAAKRKRPGEKAKVDFETAKLMTIGFSIYKAAGDADPMLKGVQSVQGLRKKLVGQMTEIYKQISELSGVVRDRDVKVEDFFD